MENSEEPFDARAYSAELAKRRIKWIVGVIVVTIVVVIAIVWSSRIGPAGRSAATKEIAEQARVLIRDCRLYAADYNNRFPPHLAAVILRGTSTKNLVDPASAFPPPVQPPFGDPKDWKTIAGEIDAKTIFTYAGAGVRAGDPPNIIVLYTRPGVIPNQRIVGYIEGNVETIPESHLAALIEANNNTRRDTKRPIIILDKPVAP